IAPARRAVELGDQGLVVFNANLIDTVLEAVERQQAPVRTQADGLQRIQQLVGRQGGKGKAAVGDAGIGFSHARTVETIAHGNKPARSPNSHRRARMVHDAENEQSTALKTIAAPYPMTISILLVDDSAVARQVIAQ